METATFYEDRKLKRNRLRRKVGGKGLQAAWKNLQEEEQGNAGRKTREEREVRVRKRRGGAI